MLLTSVCAADFEALLAIRIAAMRESLTRIGRFDPSRARERLLANFAPEATHFIEHNGQRAGFLVVKMADEHVQLDHLYVLPAFQGQGIGAQIIAWLKQHYPQQRIAVTALRGSAANDFYQRHGFVLISQSEWDLNYCYTPNQF